MCFFMMVPQGWTSGLGVSGRPWVHGTMRPLASNSPWFLPPFCMGPGSRFPGPRNAERVFPPRSSSSDWPARQLIDSDSAAALPIWGFWSWPVEPDRLDTGRNSPELLTIERRVFWACMLWAELGKTSHVNRASSIRSFHSRSNGRPHFSSRLPGIRWRSATDCSMANGDGSLATTARQLAKAACALGCHSSCLHVFGVALHLLCHRKRGAPRGSPGSLAPPRSVGDLPMPPSHPILVSRPWRSSHVPIPRGRRRSRRSHAGDSGLSSLKLALLETFKTCL